MHAFRRKLWTFYWLKCQECHAFPCDEKNFCFIVTVFFFPNYAVCNLRNQSISLSCMLTLLSVDLAAMNNFFLVAVIVSVYAWYIVRGATLKFFTPDILYFICNIFLFLLFLRIFVVVLHKEPEKFSYFLIETSTDSN